MLVAFIGRDKPGHLQTRIDNRPAHVDYLKSSGVVVMAGPFLDEAGQMSGSLVVIDVETLDKAREWVAGDPYAKAGLFESSSVTQWNKVIG